MKKGLIAAILFLIARALTAQTVTLSQDVFSDTSVKTSKSHSSSGWQRRAVTGVAYAGLGYLTYKYWDDDINVFFQRNRSGFSNQLSKSVGAIGQGEVQVIAWLGTTATAILTKNQRLKQTVFVWGGALLINNILTDQLKKTFQRHRPNTGDAPHEFDWRGGPQTNLSFPSAHTSNIFTTATVFATAYRDKKWVAPVAYSIAAAVGISRMHDNAHWASDVMAGAAIGFLSAKSSALLYKLASRKIHFLPFYSSNVAGMTITCQL